MHNKTGRRWALLLLLLTLPCGAQPTEKIVNGLSTFDHPAVGALLLSFDATAGQRQKFGFCSATLIGCETVLTAAHCVCEGTGADCQPGSAGLADPATMELFLQHAGTFPVTDISVPKDYEFGVRGDVAVLRLGRTVTGIPPATINTVRRPAPGAPGTLVGFGLSQDTGGGSDFGLKRQGRVITRSCEDPVVPPELRVPDDSHLCWLFEEPVGDAGLDSNTCGGDSGGPLFLTLDDRTVLAGVTSGGINPSCLAPDYSFDADVFVRRDWIRSRAGGDLDIGLCGKGSLVGEAGTTVETVEGEAAIPGQSVAYPVRLSGDVGRLRAVLNGFDDGINDFDLTVLDASGSELCASEDFGVYDACELISPGPGSYTVRVDTFQRSHPPTFQLTMTQLAEVDATPRLLNISTNGAIDAAGLIAGFVVVGDHPKRFAILGEDQGGMRNPALRVSDFGTDETLAFNDDWREGSQAEEIVTRLRAPGGASDAALALTLGPGSYLATLSGSEGAGGRGLVSVTEIAGASGERLLNISTNGLVDAERGLIAGFIVDGDGPRRVAILGENAGRLADPEIRVVTFPGNVELGRNNDWQSDPAAAEIAAKLRKPGGERDAALALTLEPGQYLAVLRDRTGRGGRGVVSVTEIAD